MGQDNCKPEPGDLIEIKRSPFYQHWAIYVGDGYVIHVTDEGASSLSLSSSSIAATTAKVKKQLLTVVVENDEWRVNNKYDRSRTPRPVEEIIRRAEQLVGKEVSYNVLFSNCEHFVTELRYGDGVSDQALNVIFGANGGVIGNALLAVADAAGITSVMSKPMT